mmetsp:Transcript_34792/g.95971  ORF Transcript_34792/g.95971 Transcript_34792/m.95971 type:complete len:402 (+) Transcript_34792:787-1992(+)
MSIALVASKFVCHAHSTKNVSTATTAASPPESGASIVAKRDAPASDKALATSAATALRASAPASARDISSHSDAATTCCAVRGSAECTRKAPTRRNPRNVALPSAFSEGQRPTVSKTGGGRHGAMRMARNAATTSDASGRAGFSPSPRGANSPRRNGFSMVSPSSAAPCAPTSRLLAAAAKSSQLRPGVPAGAASEVGTMGHKTTRTSTSMMRACKPKALAHAATTCAPTTFAACASAACTAEPIAGSRARPATCGSTASARSLLESTPETSSTPVARMSLAKPSISSSASSAASRTATDGAEVAAAPPELSVPPRPKLKTKLAAFSSTVGVAVGAAWSAASAASRAKLPMAFHCSRKALVTAGTRSRQLASTVEACTRGLSMRMSVNKAVRAAARTNWSG